MLRINLLPAYIAERRKLRVAIILSVLLFAIVTGLGLGYVFTQLNPSVVAEQALDADEKTKADAETAYEAETAQIRTQVQPLQDKVSFVEKVLWYNKLRQRIYRRAARYTYRKIEYNGMIVGGTTLSASATATSLSDIGRYYILMFGDPDLSAVSITGVPGWSDYEKTQATLPTGAPSGTGIDQSQSPLPPAYKISMTGTLIQPVKPPDLPASLTGAASSAPAAAPVPAAPPPPKAGA